MTETDTKKRLFDVKDVAAMLGFTEDWVYRKTRQGDFPHVRIGGRIRFRLEDIEQFITRCLEQHDDDK